MSDRIFGGIGLALAAFFIWGATQIQLSFITDPVGPKTFPYIIGTIMAIASAIILVKPDAEPHWPRFSRLAEIAISVGVLVAYAMLLPEIGFVIATAVAAAFLTWPWPLLLIAEFGYLAVLVRFALKKHPDREPEV